MACEKLEVRIDAHSGGLRLNIYNTQYCNHALWNPKLPEIHVDLATWIDSICTVCCLPFCSVPLAKEQDEFKNLLGISEWREHYVFDVECGALATCLQLYSVWLQD